MIPAVITGVGIVCALGDDLAKVATAVRAGESGLRAAGDHRDRLPVPGFGIATCDVRPFLVRKKDKKLLPRAAELAIPAAARALGGGAPGPVGLVVGVGREPPDEDDTTELALLACEAEGALSLTRLAGPGRAMYPPLASLRTLPNLVLAHVAMNLHCDGVGATRAGGAAAGLAALVEGWREVAEGRSACVLAGAADSLVSGTLARDGVRTGAFGPTRGPGEAAVFFCIETAAGAVARGAQVLARLEDGGCRAPTEASPYADNSAQIGDCGSVSALVAVALRIASGGGGQLGAEERGGGGAWIRWAPC